MWFRRIYQESWHIAQPPVHCVVIIGLSSFWIWHWTRWNAQTLELRGGINIRSFTVSKVMPIYTIYCYSLQTCSIWVTNFLFSLSRHSNQQFYSFQPQFPSDKVKWDTLEPLLIGHPWNTSKCPLNGVWLLNTIMSIP